MIKAAAVHNDPHPQRHIRDIAFLRSIVTNPRATRADMTAKDLQRLGAATMLNDPTNESWQLLDDPELGYTSTDQGLAFAREAWTREPTAEHLCLVEYAHRERRDLQLGLDAFVQASSIDRGSVAARLDAGETLAAMGKLLEAAEWTTSVLGVDPNHATAAARAAHYRQLVTDR